jgi:hypothetical protein
MLGMGVDPPSSTPSAASTTAAETPGSVHQRPHRLRPCGSAGVACPVPSPRREANRAAAEASARRQVARSVADPAWVLASRRTSRSPPSHGRAVSWSWPTSPLALSACSGSARPTGSTSWTRVGRRRPPAVRRRPRRCGWRRRWPAARPAPARRRASSPARTPPQRRREPRPARQPMQRDQPPLAGQPRDAGAEHGRRAHGRDQQPGGAQQHRLVGEQGRAQPGRAGAQGGERRAEPQDKRPGRGHRRPRTRRSGTAEVGDVAG